MMDDQSQKTLMRVFARKNKHRALTLKNLDGHLFFAERRRAYVSHGPLLILINDPDPIIEFTSSDQYWLPLTMRVKRGEDITRKRLQRRDAEKSRLKKIAQVALDEFGEEMRWALKRRF